MLVNPADEEVTAKHSISNQQPNDVVKPAMLNQNYFFNQVIYTVHSEVAAIVVCLHHYTYIDPLNLGRIGLHTFGFSSVTEF